MIADYSNRVGMEQRYVTKSKAVVITKRTNEETLSVSFERKSWAQVGKFEYLGIVIISDRTRYSPSCTEGKPSLLSSLRCYREQETSRR